MSKTKVPPPNYYNHLRDCLCKVTNGEYEQWIVAYYNVHTEQWSFGKSYELVEWTLLPQLNNKRTHTTQ